MLSSITPRRLISRSFASTRPTASGLTMAWRSHGTSNETLVQELWRNGLIKDERVRDAFLKVDRSSPPGIPYHEIHTQRILKPSHSSRLIEATMPLATLTTTHHNPSATPPPSRHRTCTLRPLSISLNVLRRTMLCGCWILVPEVGI